MCEFPICLAAYSKSEDRMLSSSGGIFAELAKYVLNNEGVVFGAVIDSNGKVFHKYITQIGELNELLGSKYVQSDIGNSYNKVKKFVNANRKVLFCGTPCQTEGLINFLGKSYDNLYIVDFICHGVPSYKLFHNYIKEISDGKEIDKISFRDKKYGWLDYSFRIDYKNGDVYRTIHKTNNFMHGFIFDFFLRPSCYNCQFKGIHRKTDITLGDFWGAHEEEPDFFEKNGVSVLLIHNDKAAELLKKIEPNIVTKHINVEKVTRNNPSLICSSNKNIMHDLFFRLMKSGVNKTLEGIIHPNKFQKIRNKIYRIVYKFRRKIKFPSMILLRTKKKYTSPVPTLFIKKDECCGCNVCVNVCPKNAICMKEDKEGFTYPVIKQELCIGCNSCTRVCPIKHNL